MPDLSKLLTETMPPESVPVPGLEGVTIPVLPALAGTVVVVAAILASASGTKPGSSRGGTKSGTDLSIPYDAAARLAYFEWLQTNNQDFNADGYLSFKAMYEKEAIAKATAKKLARDRATFQNKAPEPAPERKTTTSSSSSSSMPPPPPSPPKEVKAVGETKEKEEKVETKKETPFFFAEESS